MELKEFFKFSDAKIKIFFIIVSISFISSLLLVIEHGPSGDLFLYTTAIFNLGPAFLYILYYSLYAPKLGILSFILGLIVLISPILWSYFLASLAYNIMNKFPKSKKILILIGGIFVFLMVTGMILSYSENQYSREELDKATLNTLCEKFVEEECSTYSNITTRNITADCYWNEETSLCQATNFRTA